MNPPCHGLVIVHTGDGKGKTSAALNLVYRHLAHGKRAAVFFFIKNPADFEYGDVMMLEHLARQGYPVTVSMMGAGYTWRTGDSEVCRALARIAWERAATAIGDPAIDVVVCDELHIALRHGHLDLEPVLETLARRPTTSHVVTTGRDAPEALVAMADLVTEFAAVKHPLRSGVRAQAGIEY
jgi:cob(I)alamin adenosyltransferase